MFQCQAPNFQVLGNWEWSLQPICPIIASSSNDKIRHEAKITRHVHASMHVTEIVLWQFRKQ